MTNAHHRATIDVDVHRPEGPEPRGAASPGMWWVAWRQHRLQIAVLLAVVAVAAAALVALRFRIVAVYREFGCELFPTHQGDPFGSGCVDADGVQVWWNYGFSSWSGLAHLGMIAGPIVLGVFAASPIFTREFAHGTHVFALTQSVGRGRWFAAKTTVMAIPLIAGLVVLGVLMEWTDKVVSVTAYGALNQTNFFARGIVPAAVGLVAFGLALALGMVTRNVLAALIAGALIGGVILAGLAFVQPHLLPADRTSTAIATMFPPVTQADIDTEQAQATDTHVVVPADRNQLYVGWGYLDTSGASVSVQTPPVVGTLNKCYAQANKAGEDAATAAGLSNGSDGSVQISGDAVAARRVNADSEAFYNSPEYRTAYNQSMRGCFADLGIVAQYQDYLPGSMLWPLRWAIAGIGVILAALFLGLAAWRLRSAVAKR